MNIFCNIWQAEILGDLMNIRPLSQVEPLKIRLPNSNLLKIFPSAEVY